MFDLKMLLNQLDLVKENLKKRGEESSVLDTFVDSMNSRRDLILERDQLNQARKKYAEQFSQATAEEKVNLTLQIKQDKARLYVVERSLEEIESALHSVTMRLPNLLDEDVPLGLEPKIIREPKFLPKQHGPDHLALARSLYDPERATKLSGPRYPLLRGKLARLERAVGQFFLDSHTKYHGYEEVAVPYIVNREVMEGTGQLPKFEKDLFQVGEQFLIPTAEVPLTNLYRNEILTVDMLPIKLTALTPCFRAEGGAAGSESRGLIRQHQFNKVELVQIVKPEDSEYAHKSILKDAEAILRALELPYREVLLAAEDTSFAAAKCYDLEVWLPSQQAFREISSVSNFRDFQARRANIKYRDENGNKHYVHTSNGSGLAVGRTVVAILENYAQEDGSIVIPHVLRKYTEFDKIEF